MAKRCKGHSVVCLWNFFLLIEIHGKPMDSKNLKYILLLVCFFLDHGQLRESPAVGKFSVHDQVLASVWLIIDSRTLFKAWEMDSFFFSLLPLACSSGADCAIGEYCSRCKLKRDWWNYCKGVFPSQCLIDLDVCLLFLDPARWPFCGHRSRLQNV